MTLPRRRLAGFVLVYVLAIIAFLASLILEHQGNYRKEIRQQARMHEYALARLRLQAAADWLDFYLQSLSANTLAQSLGLLDKTDPLQTAAATPNAEQTSPLPKSLVIDNAEIGIAIENAQARPDVNALLEADWIRLLKSYGIRDAEAAARYATTIVERQQSLPNGFATARQAFFDPQLTLAIGELQRHSPAGLPALDILFAAHGGQRLLHVRDSPIALFGILFDATQAQLERFASIRTARRATIEDAVSIFGAEARDVCKDHSPTSIALTLNHPNVESYEALRVDIGEGQIKIKRYPLR